MTWSNFKCPAVKMIKKHLRINKLSFSEFLKNSGLEFRALAEWRNGKEIPIIEIGLYKKIFELNYVNFFIETEALSEFLETTEIHDFSAVRHGIFESGNSITVANINDLSFNESKSVSGMIHFRNRERSLFYTAFVLGEDIYIHATDGEDFSKSGVIKECIPQHGGDDYEDFYGTGIDKDAASQSSRWERLICNMYLYAQCFPECILTGPPKDFLDLNQYTRTLKAVHLTTAEEILDRTGVTPHFRRGHFRLLQSEFYTKKQGQIVFVKSAFVKGKAVTIIKKEGEL